MKRFLVILLCLLMVAGMTACGEPEEDTGNSTTTTEESISKVSYAHDPVIDRFFVAYAEAYPGRSMDTQTIRRGKDISEYFAIIDQCNVTVRNASYEITPEDGSDPYTVYLLRLSIEGGTTTESRDAMMGAFSKIARTIDEGCTTDTVNATIAYLEKQTETVQDYRFCNGVKIETYVPIVEEYNIPCRIELLAYNYVPLENDK